MSAEPKPYAHKGDLTNGPIKTHLIRMTLPMIWGLLAVISVQLADTYFISLMHDTNILAGFSYTFPVTMIISHIIFGINIALSSVVSRLIGSGQMEDVKRVVLHGLMLAFTASAIIALLTFVTLEPLFTLLGADENTLPTIFAYMPLWLVASIVLSLPVNANTAMRAAGDTTIPAIVMISIAIVNFILDPILIFGYFGIPALGVQGAAIATLISFIIGALIALYILAQHKKLVAIDGLHLDTFKDSIKRLSIIAIPAGIANIISPASGAVIIAVLSEEGPEAVAAFGVTGRVEALAMLAVIALALGMAPIIGQNWGAQKFDRVHKTINMTIGFNLLWSAAMAILLAVLAYPIANSFSDDPEVVSYIVLFFWIVPFSYGVGNIVFGWSSAFNAMGKPQKAFIMIFVKSFILTIPGVYLGAWLYGAKGVFIAIALTNIIGGVLFHILSNHQCKKAQQQCSIET